MIPFNKPYLTGKETQYIFEAVNTGHISGNGTFTKECHRFLKDSFGFKKVLLTTSCTDALEMAAMLINIQPGDEVIIPSYTFVSTALAFVRQGADIVFADSTPEHPNLDATKLESLINSKTKAIVPVHYAGVACDMDAIMELAHKHQLYVIEDAAQAIDSYYKGRPLGTIGHLSAFSFHETKNIQSGEGGFLGINDEKFIKRAEILWEKGTNRAEFFRGEVNKYGWVDTGSSFLPSDIIAAFLFAQLEHLHEIQNRRKEIWNQYFKSLKELETEGYFKLPVIPEYATNNAHMFYLLCNTADQRNQLLTFLKQHGVHAVFHYLSLHSSPFYSNKYRGNPLPNSDHFSDTLVRLPFYFELSEEHQLKVIHTIERFFRS
ncbi:MAG TPA: dTDP-4-amino-4,6-dideoxygalactose transaminase [Marinilabiliales bacterium]|nr:MAG: dTDP-4-amino-4,6-dideoxygalactose transaminase [Bacteroidetes bacterium GWA2_40_14]OFX60220.1 MAG: dTDP-4-amino-4,6-dideoxygalactose transaminase [Bacteroidetes bacterium GWC2_40_13]OFX75026.1 MAG: dTDP-4-amino-4,6-dideoxygalactose transaminase [Bacteroidetes bacterium GWD2_40_43]OFX89638.1 MAG: dTDP-4-amino-4,6-dideoxygalactose transaminase [Bacteroidetes bacterium GWE2_40_63]OFY24156.1 MAG: dTDP-4-amino-4,6-dideoxygalactose transaminase [Bacteroidetes bacterium GWF2_40_13]OFZ26348.1 